MNIRQTTEQEILIIRYEHHRIVLHALGVLNLGHLKGMQSCDWTSGPAGWQLNLTSCKTGDINISKQTDGKCSFDHIVIFVRPEKTLSPWPCYRFASRKGTTVCFLPLTPLCVWYHCWAVGGPRLLKTQPFHLLHMVFLAPFFFCFEDAGCQAFYSMKWLKIKPKSFISMSVNYQQSHLSSLIRPFRIMDSEFSQSVTDLTWSFRKKNVEKLELY